MNNFRRYDTGKIMRGELNYRQQVLDEICLEGLSGITLQVANIAQKLTPASVLALIVDCLPPGALGASVR